MSFLRMPFVRVGLTVVFIGLFCLSVLMIKTIVTRTWQGEQREEALYLKSPNCFSHNDPTEVDNRLPPCQDFTAIVVAKPHGAVAHNNGTNSSYMKHLQLTLKFPNGTTLTVGDIYQDKWDAIHIGDTAAIKYWHGHVREVNVNGEVSSILDMSRLSKPGPALLSWMVIGFVCSFCLSFMWRKPSAQRGWLARFG